MATLTYSAYKNGSYGASAASSDPYFVYDSISYSGTIGQSSVTRITACKFTNANTNGSSSTGQYRMEVQIELDGLWYVIGYITATKTTSHKSWSDFTSTAPGSTRSLMGKFAPTKARLKVTHGYFHLNSGSTLSRTATTELDYATSSLKLDKTSVDAGSQLTVAISMNNTAL